MAEKLPDGVLAIDAPFAGAPLNLFLIKGEGWTLIDTGIAETPEKFIFPFLKQNNIQKDEIRRVIITHGHHDHFGGNLKMYEACPDTEFMAHILDAGWAEEPLRYFNEMYLSYGKQWEPDDAYKKAVLAFTAGDSPITKRLDGECGVINLGDGVVLQYNWLGSHSPGEMMLKVSPQGCLFVGDALQGIGTQLENGSIVFPLFNSTERYERALRLIEESDCEWICTSHSGIFSKNEIAPLLRQCREFAEKHQENILNVLRGNVQPVSLHELALALHDRFYSRHEMAYQIHATTYAQCQYLCKNALIKAVPWQGHLAYTAL